MTEGVNFGRMALANPSAAPVDALLEGLNFSGGVAHHSGWGAYDSEFSPLIGTAIGRNAVFGVRALATAPLRMLQLLGGPNPLSPATPSVEPASFTPIGIPPLTIAPPSSANAQFKWVTGTPPPQPQFMLAGIPQEAAHVNFAVSSSTTIRCLSRQLGQLGERSGAACRPRLGDSPNQWLGTGSCHLALSVEKRQPYGYSSGR